MTDFLSVNETAELLGIPYQHALVLLKYRAISKIKEKGTNYFVYDSILKAWVKERIDHFPNVNQKWLNNNSII